MRFDFDPAKDAADRLKHGVPLSFGTRVFDDANASVIPTVRVEDDEDRLKLVGLIDGKPWTAVHMWRDDVARLISVRRSNANEQRNYNRNSRGSQ